jgi:hypothetical protein
MLSLMEKVNEGCQPPIQDFVELIPELPPNGSKTVFPVGIFKSLKNISLALGQASPKPNYSYLENCSPKLVCVFELTATTDDGSDVAEANEHNNRIVRVVERKVAVNLD